MKTSRLQLDQNNLPIDVYQLVLKEVELPLLNAVMEFSNYNQSKAAKILGINRTTLRTKLEKAYDKLAMAVNRVIEINQLDDSHATSKAYVAEEKQVSDTYLTTIKSYAALMAALAPANRQQDLQVPNVKPIQALKPSFTLSFDNTPTELHSWVSQFSSYFKASKIDTLAIPMQQSFIRQGVHPELWTAISQYINDQTSIFDQDDDYGDGSCIGAIKEAFQIKYPKIMRRYKFFTYQRKGNQTFTSFYSQLKELALAAELETMDQNDYLIFRIIIGINDPATVDKLLAIPQENFHLEEIHRVATALEAAKNYSSFKHNGNPANSSNFVAQKNQNNKKFSNKPKSKLDTLKSQRFML